MEIARTDLTEVGSGFLVCELAFDTSGEWIIAASQFGEVAVVARATGAIEAELRLAGRVSVDVSPDDRRLAALSSQGDLVLFDTQTWEEVARRGGDAALPCVRFGPEGQRLFLGGPGGEVQVLDASTLELRARLLGHTDVVRTLDYDPRGRWLVTASHDGTARVWDAVAFEPVATLEMAGKVYGVAFSPDGARVVTGSGDGWVRAWGTDSWTELARLPGHTDYIYDVDFSPDGETVLSAGGDGAVRLWRTRKLHELFAEIDAYEAAAERVEPLVERLFGEPEGIAVERLEAEVADLRGKLERLARDLGSEVE